MSVPARLFLYGTLMQGACNPVAVALHEYLAPGVPGTVAGLLFALPDPRGWYPAMIPGSGVVAGAVHTVLAGFDAALLARLDAWEDARPGGEGEYRRGAVLVATGDGAVTAEAYSYNVPLPPGALPVPKGDFAGFLAAQVLPAFR